MIRTSLLALALCSLLTACGDDGGGGGNTVDCAQSTLTYDNFGSQFMDSYCLGCHSTSVSGGARGGAPVAVNFDELTQIQTQKGRIKARVNAKTMPPATANASPSQAEIDDLVEWIDCGVN